MRKLVLLGASALVLCLGVATASAEPFNPATNSYSTQQSGNLEQFHEGVGR